ncbi:MAG: phage tail length tape measure family protein [Rhodospirillaceae bacterium]
MTVKLGARIEADVSPLVDALNTGGEALDRFEGRMLAANDDLARLGDAGSASLEGLASGAGLAAEALSSLVQPAKESARAITELGRAAEETAASVSEVDRAAGNTSGLDNLARATNAVGDALAELTAGDEELAREAAANQQQLQILADARTAMGETLRRADRDNADTSREILDQASRIAEDGFAARVALEKQFWDDNQRIEEAGGKTALEVMTAGLAEQNAVMAEELTKRNQTAREQTAELRTTLDDAYKEYLAPALGRSDDIAGNNRSLIPTGGAMLNQALEQAGYGPADQTWQETVVRGITDGLETIGATAERTFSTLKESGSSALHEIGSESGVAEQAAAGFGVALDGIGSAASSAVDGLVRLVTDGLRATEQGFAETGAAAQVAGQDVVSATAAVGSGGAAMGREVAEGAETGSAALTEMERMGEGVALGMAARAGAIGTALRALGPVGLGAAAVIGGLFLAFDDAKKAEDELTGINQALARTGAAATLTARDVQALAENLSQHSMASRADILQAEQELMQYHSVLGGSFEKTLQLSADLSAALGGTLSANVKLLGAALDEPEQALENLERAGVRFTESQRDLIESLAESGRKFEAQQAILDAVAESVGGADAGAQSGLTGRVKGLTEAWRSFVEYFTGSDSLIGQTVSNVTAAITGLSGALGVVVDSITSALDHSIESQIDKLQKEKEALEAQLKSGDFGFQGFFDKYLGNSDAARKQAEDQVRAINQSIADLNAKQHQQDLVEAIAAEDKQGKVRTEMARIVAGEIVEIDDALNDRLNELSSTRIDKIREEADAQIRVIEGQKAQAQSLGLDTTQYDAAILKVRQWETAEAARAEATERSTKATREGIDPNLKLIESLQAELVRNE